MWPSLAEKRENQIIAGEGPGVIIQELKPIYKPGDYIKVEFSDEGTGVAEWMWVRIRRCDEAKQIVFGTLDNEPVNDATGKLKLGTELAISFSQIREHKAASEFNNMRSII